MKRVAPITFVFNYVNSSDSEERLMMAYTRIFNIARKNLIQKRTIDNISKRKYSIYKEGNEHE